MDAKEDLPPSSSSHADRRPPVSSPKSSPPAHVLPQATQQRTSSSSSSPVMPSTMVGDSPLGLDAQFSPMSPPMYNLPPSSSPTHHSSSPHAGSVASDTVINLRVCVAHTGREFEFHARPDQSVSTLSMWLASQADIPTHEQILLCEDGVKIDAKHKIHRYSSLGSLGSPDKPGLIFLYNRQHLRGAPPELSQLLLATADDLLDVRLPDTNLRASVADHPLLVVDSVMARNLPNYEAQFLTHVQHAEAYIEAASARTRACWEMLTACRTRLKSLDVAALNLDSHRDKVQKKVASFLERYKSSAAEHKAVLDTFEYDMAQLGHVELHPLLRTPQKSTLLDCISENKLRTWANAFSVDEEKLGQKVSELVASQRDVEDAVQRCRGGHPAQEFSQLEQRLKDCESTKVEQQAMLQTLIKDYDYASQKVSMLVSELKESQDLATDVSDIALAFEEQNRTHRKKLLPRFKEIDQQLKAIMKSFAEAQRRLTSSHFFSRLTLVADVQTRMRNMANRVVAYDAAMTKHSKDFKRLTVVRNMPNAYNACLVEISRRRAYQRILETEFNRAKSRLSTLVDIEAPKRESFNAQFGAYLPDQLFTGLSSRPPNFELRLKHLNNKLPAIDNKAMDEELRKAISLQDVGLDSSFVAMLEAELALHSMASSMTDSSLQVSSSSTTPYTSEQRERHLSLISSLQVVAKQMNMRLQSQVGSITAGSSAHSDAHSDTSTEAKSTSSPPTPTPTPSAPSPSASASSAAQPQRSSSETDSADSKIRKLQKALRKAESRLATRTAQLEECQANSADLENQLHNMQKKLDQLAELETKVSELSQENAKLASDGQEMMRRTARLLAENGNLTESAEMWKEQCRARIQFTSFQVKDLALFYLASNGQHYVAFNRGCPHRYLSPESKKEIQPHHKQGVFVAGEILFIEKKTAPGNHKDDQKSGNDSSSSASDNPYSVPAGTDYFMLTVELIPLASKT